MVAADETCALVSSTSLKGTHGQWFDPDMEWGASSAGTGSNMGQRASAANPSVPAKLDQHLEKTKSQPAESR
jgi:hypothetical protein